jgi:hypothetical protein
MERKKISAIWCLAVLMLAAPMTANALTLNTPPLPDGLGSGDVKCVVSNVGTKTGNVTVTIFATDGNIIVGGFGPTPLAANATTETPAVDLSTNDASYCRFVVPNKKFKGSLVYTNGDVVEVVAGE